jgi:hypothetical protein
VLPPAPATERRPAAQRRSAARGRPSADSLSAQLQVFPRWALIVIALFLLGAFALVTATVLMRPR